MRIPLPVLGAFLASLVSAFAAPSSPPLPRNSLYQLESSWKLDDGRQMRLVELRGKPRVMALFFSRCDDVCPMLTGQLKALEGEMPADLRERTGFVLITLDPAGDDTTSLRGYRRRMNLSKKHWLLARGSADDTRELANLLGVTYQPKKNDGQIDHNGLVVLLDKEGRIVKKFTGITDRKAFLALLRKTAATR
ncbi:MAG: hypothetical protein K0Q91_594 [Fibrobacteria bacterium]|jgi:protein SCO1/2|nr:hypothetical protein [Fibrobacteria bacterium]